MAAPQTPGCQSPTVSRNATSVEQTACTLHDEPPVKSEENKHTIKINHSPTFSFVQDERVE